MFIRKEALHKVGRPGDYELSTTPGGGSSFDPSTYEGVLHGSGLDIDGDGFGLGTQTPYGSGLAFLGAAGSIFQWADVAFAANAYLWEVAAGLEAWELDVTHQGDDNPNGNLQFDAHGRLSNTKTYAQAEAALDWQSRAYPEPAAIFRDEDGVGRVFVNLNSAANYGFADLSLYGRSYVFPAVPDHQAKVYADHLGYAGFYAIGNAIDNWAFQYNVLGEAQPRVYIAWDGSYHLGGGVDPPDVTLQRVNEGSPALNLVADWGFSVHSAAGGPTNRSYMDSGSFGIDWASHGDSGVYLDWTGRLWSYPDPDPTYITEPAIQISPAGEAEPRWVVGRDGTVHFGGGIDAPDVGLVRADYGNELRVMGALNDNSFAGLLVAAGSTDPTWDWFAAGSGYVDLYADTSTASLHINQADAGNPLTYSLFLSRGNEIYPRVAWDGVGNQSWGDGISPPDVTLARVADDSDFGLGLNLTGSGYTKGAHLGPNWLAVFETIADPYGGNYSYVREQSVDSGNDVIGSYASINSAGMLTLLGTPAEIRFGPSTPGGGGLSDVSLKRANHGYLHLESVDGGLDIINSAASTFSGTLILEGSVEGMYSYEYIDAGLNSQRLVLSDQAGNTDAAAFVFKNDGSFQTKSLKLSNDDGSVIKTVRVNHAGTALELV